MTDPENKKDPSLAEKYKLEGAQQTSYDEYATAKAKSKTKRSSFKIPTFVKFIIGAPFVIIFIFGILFIPYIIYLILTSPSAPAPVDVVKNTYDTAR